MRGKLLSAAMASLIGVASGLWIAWKSSAPNDDEREPFATQRATNQTSALSQKPLIGGVPRVGDHDSMRSRLPVRHGAPGALGQFMEYTELRSADGGLRAIQIAAGAGTVRIHELGLKPGDLLIAMDGISIASMENAERFFAALEESYDSQVTVVRNGSKYELKLNLAGAVVHQ